MITSVRFMEERIFINVPFRAQDEFSAEGQVCGQKQSILWADELQRERYEP